MSSRNQCTRLNMLVSWEMKEAQKYKPIPAKVFQALGHVTPTNSNGHSMLYPNTKSWGRKIFSASLGMEGSIQCLRRTWIQGRAKKWGYQCNLLHMPKPSFSRMEAGILPNPPDDFDAC